MQFLPSFDLNLPTFLFGFFAFMGLLQLLYTFIIYGKLAFYSPSKQQEKRELLPPVSVIIAARNEADNLFENLPFILQQDYPEFEVIVINNQSIDDSSHLLMAYSRQYPNLKVIEVAKNPHLKPGKKLPLTIGIKGAKYEHFVFTDADCKPSSSNWLKSIANGFNAKSEMVLAYGPYTKEKGFLNSVIRFDTTWIAMNYFSLALARMPYMGVGRNLAYTRSLFNSVHGFKSHYSLPSGDDDLFVQEAATKGNYSINLDPEAFCYSEPSRTWESWLRQKSRHYTTSPKYQVIKKWMLGIYPFTLLMLLISFVILMFNTDFRWLSLAAFLLITFLKWWIQARCFSKLKESGFIKFLPLYDWCYAVIMPFIYYSSETKTSNRW